MSADVLLSRRYSAVLLVGGTIASIFLYYDHPSEVTHEEVALGLLIVWLGLLPSVLLLRGYGSGPLPLMPAIGLFYCIAFGLPVFLDFSSLRNVSWVSEVSPSAQWLVATGMMALYVSYYLFRNGPGHRISAFSLNVAANSASLSPILWLFIGAHLADILFHISSVVPSIGHLLDAASLIGYGWLSWMLFQGQLSPLARGCFLLIVLPLELLVRITSGSLAQPMKLGLLILFIYWLVRQKVPWAALFIVGFMLVELHSVKGRYRELTWAGGELSRASSWERLKTFTTLALERQDALESSQTGLLSNSFALRAAQLGFMTRVVEQTPEVIPYWNGETYAILIYKLIPRIVWPDKPVETLGRDLSFRYGLRDISDETTSFNVPWILEMYANFGTIGVIGGMSFIGIGFAFLDRKFNRRTMPLLDRIVGTVLLFDLVYQESNLSLMIGNKVLVYLALRVIFQVLPKQNRTQPLC